MIPLLQRLVAAVWLLALLAACAPTSPSESRGLPLELCQLAAPGIPLRVEAECGALTVWEDRVARSGRQIALRLARVPATGRDPEPDPLFFLTGGPGQAATESFVLASENFERIRQRRDVVLVDQRGTGQSNALRCPEVEAERLPEEAGAISASALRACLAQLDADPTLYTTAMAVEDLEQVRDALGYERINLYGLSYGTRVALAYLRQYPGRVRTLILDGVAPPELPLGRDVARDAQRALDLLWDRCEADAACGSAFPNVRAEWAALLAHVAAQPAELIIEHPVTATPTEVTLTRAALASAVRLLSYAPETAALLPLLVHRAHESGDLSDLAAQYLLVSEDLSGTISEGMNFSVLCSEDFPFFTPEEAEAASEGTYLGNLQSDQLQTICSVWPRAEVPAALREPVESPVPTLILSGEADPVTPPAYGDQVAQHLPNSLHLVAPGQGHSVVGRGCLPKVITLFVRAGTLAGLDTRCVARIEAPPFFLSPTGSGAVKEEG